MKSSDALVIWLSSSLLDSSEDYRIDKLTLEMENLTPVDVNYVMGILGTKYLPSAFYKLRLLPFDSNAMWARTYGAMGLGTAQAPQG